MISQRVLLEKISKCGSHNLCADAIVTPIQSRLLAYPHAVACFKQTGFALHLTTFTFAEEAAREVRHCNKTMWCMAI